MSREGLGSRGHANMGDSLPTSPLEDCVADWTDADELSGPKAFDVWPFIDAEHAISWDC